MQCRKLEDIVSYKHTVSKAASGNWSNTYWWQAAYTYCLEEELYMHAAEPAGQPAASVVAISRWQMLV